MEGRWCASRARLLVYSLTMLLLCCTAPALYSGWTCGEPPARLHPLLQGPVPAAARARDPSRSPASRPGSFLGDVPHLSSLELACLSPRRPLPGCSPLPPSIAGLREPPSLPGLAPLAGLAPRHPLLLPGVLRGPPGSTPPRPLLRSQPPHPAGWRPLGAAPAPRPGQAPQLMRSGAPLPPHGTALLRPQLGGGGARPAGGSQVHHGPFMVPLPGGMHRGGERMADWAPVDDGGSMLCATL